MFGGDFLADKMSEVYETYDMEVLQTMRGRGSVILKTDKGVRQLKQLDVNESRLNAEYQFKEKLYELGFIYIDRCIKNKQDELISYDRYGNAYVMRTFFEGREIDVENKDEITAAVKNLAEFHIISKEIFDCTEGDVHIRFNSDFRKRNQELKRVRNFMTKRKTKKEFEEIFLNNYDFFYKQAADCESKIASEDYMRMTSHMGYCHGMYNHHSVLVPDGDSKNPATIAFDKFYVGSQLNDLYHFIRKTVEKNNYDFEIMKSILETYNSLCSLTKKDIEYIYILYLYPEKFYKLSNQYINAPKNWISPKMMEKIDKIIMEEEQKQALLGKLNRYYMEI